MSTDQKILNEVISLQALHAEGLKRATTLRGILEGGVKPSTKALRRTKLAVDVVNRRNIKLLKKCFNNGN